MIRAMLFSVCEMTNVKPIFGRFCSKEEFLRTVMTLKTVENYEYSAAFNKWIKNRVWLIGGIKAYAIWFSDGTVLELRNGQCVQRACPPDTEYVNRMYNRLKR